MLLKLEKGMGQHIKESKELSFEKKKGKMEKKKTKKKVNKER